MFYGIALLVLLSAVQASDPDSYVVIESTVCGNCKYFNNKDISHLLGFSGYQTVVKTYLVPHAHVSEKKDSNGNYYYEHMFGEQYMQKAYYQFCANHLYDDQDGSALKWATKASYATSGYEAIAATVFADKGAAVIACVNDASQRNEFARADRLIYNKNRFSGRLPFVVNQKDRSLLQNLFSKRYLQLVCDLRDDRDNQAVCQACKNDKLKFLDEKIVPGIEIADEETITETSTESFDYEKFWNTYDD